MESGSDVTETYREYIYIYLPGILGAILALVSIQLPLIGRKWSLVIAATLQGLSMAMYTQVKNTAGYVGLNALEYIMQTVSRLDTSQQNQITDLWDSFSTQCCMPPHPRCSIQHIVLVQAECFPVWDVLLAL